MRSLAAVATVTLLLAGSARAEEKKPGAPPAPAPLTGEPLDRALYATGLSISKSLEPFALSGAELGKVYQGIKDGVAGKPKFELDDQANKSVQQLVQARLAVAAEKEKAKSEGYLKKAAAEKGAVRTESGMVYTSIKEGSGAQPGATDKVKVHYVGKLADGKVFDSSVARGQPLDFPLNQVIGCWTEGLQKMKVGGKAKLVCPSDIAYGPSGRPPAIPGNAVLTFDVELLGVESSVKPPAPAPPAPAAPAK